MRIIIPMAGRGTRLRPATLTLPKPLIPVAGKPMVQLLVETLSKSFAGQIEEIAFIVGDFGADVERDLIEIAQKFGAKGTIYRQEKALGVGHAILQAAPSLHGKTMVAFADTLFKCDFAFDPASDGVIWVQKVADPSMYGVVKLDADGIITELVEKPSTPVSNLAIVGIYYFREGEKLRAQLERIVREGIKEKNEFQLTTALEFLKNEGTKFRTGEVEEWLDCGNKDMILQTNERMLAFADPEKLVSKKATIENSVILAPSFVGAGATIKNSVIGPFASIGEGSKIENSVIASSIVQQKATVRNAVLASSMIGNHAGFLGSKKDVSLSDYSVFKS